MSTATTKRRRIIHSMSPEARRAYVEQQLELAPVTRRGKRLMLVTYSTVRGTGQHRTATVDVLGVASSAVYGADELIVRDGNDKLFAIPLTVLRDVDPAVCPACGRPGYAGRCDTCGEVS